MHSRESKDVACSGNRIALFEFLWKVALFAQCERREKRQLLVLKRERTVHTHYPLAHTHGTHKKRSLTLPCILPGVAPHKSIAGDSFYIIISLYIKFSRIAGIYKRPHFNFKKNLTAGMQLFSLYRTGEIEIRTPSIAHTLRCRRVTRFHVGERLHGSGTLNRFFNKLRTVTALLGTPLRGLGSLLLFLDKQPGREHEQACSYPE